MWYVWFGLFFIVGHFFFLFSTLHIPTIIFVVGPFIKELREADIAVDRRIYKKMFFQILLHTLIGVGLFSLAYTIALPPMAYGFTGGVFIGFLRSIKGMQINQDAFEYIKLRYLEYLDIFDISIYFFGRRMRIAFRGGKK